MTTHLVFADSGDQNDPKENELNKLLERFDSMSHHRKIRRKRVYRDLTTAVDDLYPGDVLYLLSGNLPKPYHMLT